MKILVVAPIPLNPPLGGDGIRITNLVANLPEADEVSIVSPTCRELLKASRPVSHITVQVVRHSPAAVVLRTLVFGLPYDSSRFSFPSSVHPKVLGRFDIGYIHLGAGWDLYRRLSLSARPSVLVADLQNDDPEMWRQRATTDRSAHMRLASRLYARRARRKLHGIARQADGFFCVSEQDKGNLVSRDGVAESRITVVPNGVDTSFFRPDPNIRRRNHLVFLGSLDVRMNQVAVKALLSSYWPAIKESCPQLALKIIGRNPPAWMISEAQACSVEVIGSPADIRQHLWGSVGMIAPFASGGGTKIKILEAMAAGVPVLATSAAAAGIGALPGRHYLEVTSERDAAGAVSRLVSDTALSAGLSSEGHELSGRFDWRRIALLARAVFQEALAAYAGFVPADNSLSLKGNLSP